MKYFYSFHTFLFLLILFSSNLNAQTDKRCSSFEYNQAENSSFHQPENIERLLKLRDQYKSGEIEDTYLPVVVHVLHNNSDGSIGGNNISDEQIQSQIDRLNIDFAGLSEELSSIPDTFKNIVAYGTGFQFCLATVDENGQNFNGITRTYTTKTVFTDQSNDAKKSGSGGKSPFSRCDYINIWVVPELEKPSGQTVLGYAQLPGGNAASDGIVIRHQNFGDDTGTSIKGAGSTYNAYYKGRTLVHEMGHFLGLKHIWGDVDGCNVTDNVLDTPNQQTSSVGCPAYPQVSCGAIDMTMNYMDYSDDECMYAFTIGQAELMQATMLGARSCMNGAFERSCGAGCLADYGTLDTIANKNVCFRKDSDGNRFTDTLSFTNGVSFPGYETAFVITENSGLRIIKDISYGTTANFANLVPGEYGVHPISYKISNSPLDLVQIGSTTLGGLQSFIDNGSGCGKLMTENHPIFTLQEYFELDITVECLTDGLGNNQGVAEFSTEIIGGFGNVIYVGPGNGTIVEDGESFLVTATDEVGCQSGRIGEIECAEYRYSVTGFNFIDEQQVFTKNNLYVIFNSDDDLPITVNIYNLVGQSVYQNKIENPWLGINDMNIDTHFFSPGIYLLVLDNRNERIEKKILRH